VHLWIDPEADKLLPGAAWGKQPRRGIDHFRGALQLLEVVQVDGNTSRQGVPVPHTRFASGPSSTWWGGCLLWGHLGYQ